MKMSRMSMFEELFQSLLFDEVPDKKDALIVTSFRCQVWFNKEELLKNVGKIEAFFALFHFNKGFISPVRLGYDSDEDLVKAEKDPDFDGLWTYDVKDSDMALAMFIAAGLMKLPERDELGEMLRNSKSPADEKVIEVL